ncbi:finger putative transcription factor family-related [Holotrichia oblita]|uniref:Finger putative transcription factor family-related n=1 Tax=Holotrichia oblita TaxID=644536 RepID=A0ACB9SR48_HOLOL|nr:finger putative transcription factor family-related [Holotrichia oblita]
MINKDITAFGNFCGTPGKKPLQCAYCSKEFITKAHLELHILNHTGRKPYSCDSCGKSFLQYAKLKRHTLLHSNLKPCVCQKCGKSFRTNDKLKVHALIHTKEKPFACKQCKAKFNNSSNLKKHMAVHIKEGIHMCDQCGKRFKLRSTLMTHNKIHSSNKSHKCPICTKAFHNMKDLKRHTLIHADEKAYNCDMCNTSFRRKDNLNRHLRNTHPGKKATYTQKIVKAPLTKPSLVENPNAIKVITPSPTCNIIKKQEPVERDQRTVPVINGPIKLASKTNAFKDCYNINRNTSDQPESVNIYEKILLPNNTIPKVNEIQTIRKPSEILKSDFLPLHYGTSFEHKTHAVIKNIKFKLPKEYLNLSNKDDVNITALNIGSKLPIEEQRLTKNVGNVEPQSEVTSVIVNATNSQVSDVHWRKRTTQNFNASHVEEL